MAMDPIRPKSLMNPPDRIAQNIVRDAMRKVASSTGSDALTVDEAYHRARTELGLLLHNDKFRDSYEKLTDSSKKLLAIGKERVLDDPKRGGKSPEQLREFSDLHIELDGLSEIGMSEVKASKKDIETFIAVVEECRHVYSQRNYDPAGIVPDNLYSLAKMVSGKFEAYEATLRDKE